MYHIFSSISSLLTIVLERVGITTSMSMTACVEVWHLASANDILKSRHQVWCTVRYQSKTIMKRNYYFEPQTRLSTYSSVFLANFYTICHYMLRQRSHRGVYVWCDICVREPLDFSLTFFSTYNTYQGLRRTIPRSTAYYFEPQIENLLIVKSSCWELPMGWTTWRLGLKLLRACRRILPCRPVAGS